MRQSDRLLTEFYLGSQPGNERLAMRRVAEALAGVRLSRRQLDRLMTAVAEATLNAIEHGNRFQADRMVAVRVTTDDRDVQVSITDQGAGPPAEVDTPNLREKLAGCQKARGWGLFLIREMVDEVTEDTRDTGHTVSLRVRCASETTPGQMAG
jgi:anti-sigma regulatory factor (Ser/Thr protein kinase)